MHFLISIRPARSLQVSGGGADGGGGVGGGANGGTDGGVQPDTSWPLHLLLPGSGPWHSRATPDAASFQVKIEEQSPGSAFLQLLSGISVRPARSLQVSGGGEGGGGEGGGRQPSTSVSLHLLSPSAGPKHSLAKPDGSSFQANEAAQSSVLAFLHLSLRLRSALPSRRT